MYSVVGPGPLAATTEGKATGLGRPHGCAWI